MAWRAVLKPSKSSDQHKHVCVENIYSEDQVEEDQVKSGKREQELISLKEEFIRIRQSKQELAWERPRFRWNLRLAQAGE
jgi:hypothetical protein